MGSATSAAAAAGPEVGVAPAVVAPGSEPGRLAIFSSIPSPLPPNLPSVGAEAYAFRELGDQVEFAGSARRLTEVEVTLSDWACESGHWYETGADACTTTPGEGFELPITLKIYGVGSENSVGALLATDTQTFFIPYRPSSGGCTDKTAWYDAASDECYHGLATKVAFDFSSNEVTLPDKVIYGISYDTSHYGPSPIGDSASCYSSSAGCPYDSLNIALSEEVLAGVHPLPGTLYQNSPYGGEYCDNGAAGTGTFRLDSPTEACWGSYLPAVAFTVAPPSSRSQCLKGGWKGYTDNGGRTFKNQGDCVSYVASGGRNTASG